MYKSGIKYLNAFTFKMWVILMNLGLASVTDIFALKLPYNV
jgi:hypothetical protein